MAAPFDKQVIVGVFVRKANTQPNPADFLTGLLFGNFDVVTTGDAIVKTSITTGGSSANWTLPANMSRMDIMEIAELALRRIETGIDAPIQLDANGTPIPNAIKQVAPSQRVISYAQFGNIRR